MTHYFCKLIPPRPTFAQDITADERALMQEHAGYWHQAMQAGRVVVFGPVGHPDGVFGMGVITADTPEQAAQFCQQDPVVQADVGFRAEFYPMPGAFYRK